MKRINKKMSTQNKNGTFKISNKNQAASAFATSSFTSPSPSSLMTVGSSIPNALYKGMATAFTANHVPILARRLYAIEYVEELPLLSRMQ